MFVSAHDALVIGVVTAFAVVVAVRAVQLMGGGVIDDAERMRRELIAAVSHDLRTPITSLRLLTDAIARRRRRRRDEAQLPGADEHALERACRR